MFLKRSQQYSHRFFLSVLLVTCILVTSIVPIFATNSTPSALKVSKTSPLNSAILTASDTASNVFLNGYTTSRTPWAYLNYNESLNYFYNTPSTLPDLFSSLADAIARDFQQINTHVRSIEDDVDTIRNNSGTIKSSVSNIYTAINNILSYVDDISTSDDISNAASNIVTAIQNNGITIPQSLLDDVDNLSNNSISKSSIQPWIIPADDYDHSDSTWRYYFRTYLNNNGLLTTSDYYNTNILMLYKRQLSDISNNTGYLGNRSISDVIGSGISYPLFNSDLTSSNMSKNSIWKTLLEIGSNTSLHLSKLAYVLANEEDIEARQAAQSTTSTAVDNFIKPTGSASVSGSDVGTLADIGSNVIGNMNTGVNASDSLSVFDESSDSWSWFTQDTANAFDSTGDNRVNNSLRSKSTSETPYLDSYYDEVMAHVR